MTASLDAASPAGEPPAKPQHRYLSIDVLRAVAILAMIEVHAVDNFSDDIPDPDYLYVPAQLIGHTSAPLFTLLAGLSYALWLGAQRRAAQTTETIVKYSLRRGMFVFILGLVLNFFTWLPEGTFDWDILTLIGGAAIILLIARNWPPWVLIAISVAVLLASPPLRELVSYDSYWRGDDFTYDPDLGAVLLGFVLTGYFPLLPWIVFPLTGFALGRLFYPDDKEAALPFSVPLLGLALIALGSLGALLEKRVPGWIANYYATEWPDGFYPATTVFMLLALGGTLVALWIMNRIVDRNPHVTGTGVVFTFFRRYSHFALSAYVIHMAAQLWPMWIWAWWQNKTPFDIYLARFVSVQTALISALVLIIVLYVYFIFLDRHRKYSLEYFMRWLST